MIELKVTFKDFEELQKFLDLRSKGEVHTLPAAKSTKQPKEATVAVVPDGGVTEGNSGDLAVDVDPPSGVVNFAVAKQAILDLSKAKDREAAITVLAKFNDKAGKPCERVTAVLEADYPALVAAAKEAMA